MYSPKSLLESPSRSVRPCRRAPLGFPNEEHQTNPFRIDNLLLSTLYRWPANPSGRREPNPFSAAARSLGRRVIGPRGRAANAANPRVIIPFSHHFIPEVKSTWH